MRLEPSAPSCWLVDLSTGQCISRRASVSLDGPVYLSASQCLRRVPVSRHFFSECCKIGLTVSLGAVILRIFLFPLNMLEIILFTVKRFPESCTHWLDYRICPTCHTPLICHTPQQFFENISYVIVLISRTEWCNQLKVLPTGGRLRRWPKYYIYCRTPLLRTHSAQQIGHIRYITRRHQRNTPCRINMVIEKGSNDSFPLWGMSWICFTARSCILIADILLLSVWTWPPCWS